MGQRLGSHTRLVLDPPCRGLGHVLLAEVRLHSEVRRALAEGDERGPGHLEAGDAERDPDDGEAEEDARKQVAEREPPARQDEPEDVCDDADRLAARRARNECASERPQRVDGELERLHPERDPDDRDEEERAGDRVGDLPSRCPPEGAR